jgi:CPA2 family monovalent cation:H+ antiporter-2
MSVSEISVDLPDVELSILRVSKGSLISGKSLIDLELRKRLGVSVLAIRRGDRIISNPDADTRLLADDIVVALGTPDKIAAVTGLFRSEK